MQVLVAPPGNGGAAPETSAIDMSGPRQQQQQEQRHPVPSRPVPELDLKDWSETRVLAKYKKGESVFVQGVIKASDCATDLVVEFEGPEGGLRQTYDVINSNRFDIIADASPSISDVRGWFQFDCTGFNTCPLPGDGGQPGVCAHPGAGPGRVRLR